MINIFDECCPNSIVLAYGSRLKNEAHELSDLDLSIKNLDENICSLNKLKEIISNSNNPFIVYINNFDSMPDYFKDEIIRNNVVIYGK